MAVLAAAQLLDELMGRNRNVAPNEKVRELNWEDPEYCKYFLAKFCPHDLFVNTRVDLGACSKVHDEEVKKLFDNAKSTHHRKVQYLEDFLRFCSSMMNDVERKIGKGKQRLALSASEKKDPSPSITPAQTQKNQEQIQILNERINDLEAEAEKAGTDGNVEQAQGLMKLCDQLKEERDDLRKQVDNGHFNATAELAAAQEKQMEVCDVCGAFLIVGDAQQRIDDHLMGKQHMGFARLKAAVVEVGAQVRAAREERQLGRPGGLGGGGGGTSGDHQRERERRRRGEADREVERGRNELRDKEKDKEREKDKHDRERRSRTADRGEKRDRDSHRSRESHKEREKEKPRKHRDSSRHRHHHHRR